MAILKKPIVANTVKIAGAEFQCSYDNGQPQVTYGNQIFKTTLSLLIVAPSLASNLSALAFIVNFLFGGKEYQFIEDIPKFQEEYLNRVEYEQNTFDYIPDRITEHGVFNVTVMHEPKIIKDELVFFVKQERTNLPFRASCPFPITTEAGQVFYQFLPFAI